METDIDHSQPSFPAWAPPWLKKLVDEPNCASGTHPVLRRIAKWLVFYMPPLECPGLAFHWLRYAANKCDRVPDDAELKRLLGWADARGPDDDYNNGYGSGGASRLLTSISSTT